MQQAICRLGTWTRCLQAARGEGSVEGEDAASGGMGSRGGVGETADCMMPTAQHGSWFHAIFLYQNTPSNAMLAFAYLVMRLTTSCLGQHLTQMLILNSTVKSCCLLFVH